MDTYADRYLGPERDEDTKLASQKSPVTDPNLFMKLVVSALLSANRPAPTVSSLLLSYRWSVEKIRTPGSEHPQYHVMGDHPAARRLDFYLPHTVIQ